MNAVDTHAHVFSSTAAAVPGARYRPAYEATLPAWRARWRTAGVTHGVLVQPSFFGTGNGEMLAALGADPAHLRGVAVVDPGCADADLDALHRDGVRAIRLNLRGAPEEDLDLAAWKEALPRIARRGWHLELFTDRGCVPRVARALVDVPIRVVLDHFGHPDPSDVEATFAAVESLARSHEVWAKLSAPYRLEGLDARELAARWLEVVGPSRLVWGSDWPWTGHEAGRDYAELHAGVARWVGVPNARAVLGDNPARLYGF